MIHPATELRQVSDDLGLGVFATARIPAGTLVYVLDDLEIRIGPDDPRRHDPRYAQAIETYAYVDAGGVSVLSWDFARFVNHSCDPNTLSSGYGFEIALRDIEVNEQITDDYGLFNMSRTLHCCCGSPACRGRIERDDPDVYADHWDAQLKIALSAMLGVPQPLMDYVDTASRRALMRYLKTGKGYRSCRALRCHEPALAVAV